MSVPICWHLSLKGGHILLHPAENACRLLSVGNLLEWHRAREGASSQEAHQAGRELQQLREENDTLRYLLLELRSAAVPDELLSDLQALGAPTATALMSDMQSLGALGAPSLTEPPAHPQSPPVVLLSALLIVLIAPRTSREECGVANLTIMAKVSVMTL